MIIEKLANKYMATIPTQNSKLYNVLVYLCSGKILTVQTAIQYCKTTELRVAVSRLKEYGWPIKDDWVTEGGDRFKQYYLKRGMK